MKGSYFTYLAIIAIALMPALSFGQVRVQPSTYPSLDKVEVPSGVNSEQKARYFDWQKRWGTIHLNSFSDKLSDPGSDSSRSGNVPCPAGTMCRFDGTSKGNGAIASYYSDIPLSSVGHGIKYDIKRSVVGCLSRPVPNFPSKNGHNYSKNYVCVPSNNMSPAKFTKTRAMRHGHFSGAKDTTATNSFVYVPMWDKRANDTRDQNVGQGVGCLQQIINSCAADMHDCKAVSNKGIPAAGKGTFPFDVGSGQYPWGSNSTPDPVEIGARFPVTHVFTQIEKDDLGLSSGGQLPAKYYRYKKWVAFKETTTSLPSPSKTFITDNSKSPTEYKVVDEDFDDPMLEIKDGWRWGLSLVENPYDKVSGSSSEEIISYDSENLTRLRAYEVDIPSGSGMNGFVVVDPSDLFNLNNLANQNHSLYSGYNVFFKSGGSSQVAHPDTCPILGVSGYSGICDPTGEGGCNLPIYGKGPTTVFTKEDGSTTSYESFPILWSGYVKKWAFISPEKYLDNTKERLSSSGVYLYERNVDSSMPVLMVTRADEYCSDRERVSGSLPKEINAIEPDMDCIQYLQYQPVDGSTYRFLDLYVPIAETFTGYAVSKMHTYNIGADGVPTTPVKGGTGSNEFVSQTVNLGEGSDFISFFDYFLPSMPTYVNLSSSNEAEDKNVPISAFEIDKEIKTNSKGFKTVGDITTRGLNGTTIENEGISKQILPGEAIALRVPDPDPSDSDISTDCAIISSLVDPNNLTEYFVPLNSYEEYQNFLTTVFEGKVPNLKARNCEGRFLTYSEKYEGATNPNGTSTWDGKINCNQLVEDRPACNQTKIISARRYCVLDDGLEGDCSKCGGVADPDADADFEDLFGTSNVTEHPDFYPGQTTCYFEAYCFNVGDTSTGGCPPANSTGGHIFCLAAGTKILMADGSEKNIDEIEAGEKVLSFDTRHTKGDIRKAAKIEATTITEDQEIIKIYTDKKSFNLEITPLHRIVISSGRGIMARDILVGDKILTRDGSIAKVTKIEKSKSRVPVYNLVLEEGADGYIANGIRVLSYPLMDGMEISH